MKKKNEQVEKQDPQKALESAQREIASIKEQKKGFEAQQAIFTSKREALRGINELQQRVPGLVRPSYTYEQHEDYWPLLEQLKQADFEYNDLVLEQEIIKIQKYIDSCDMQIESQEESVANLKKLLEK